MLGKEGENSPSGEILREDFQISNCGMLGVVLGHLRVVP
jgi:hypothetical protein